jgi:hypothetical protein
MKTGFGSCDLCGETAQTFQVWYLGYQETWGCAKCLSREEEDDYEQGAPPTFHKEKSQ